MRRLFTFLLAAMLASSMFYAHAEATTVNVTLDMDDIYSYLMNYGKTVDSEGDTIATKDSQGWTPRKDTFEYTYSKSNSNSYGYTIKFEKGTGESMPTFRSTNRGDDAQLRAGNKITVTAPDGVTMHYVYFKFQSSTSSPTSATVDSPDGSNITIMHPSSEYTTLDMTPGNSFTITLGYARAASGTKTTSLLRTINITNKVAEPNIYITDVLTGKKQKGYDVQSKSTSNVYVNSQKLTFECEESHIDNLVTYYRLQDDAEYQVYDPSNPPVLGVGDYHVTCYNVDGDGNYTKSAEDKAYIFIAKKPELVLDPKPGTYEKPQDIKVTLNNVNDTASYLITYKMAFSDGTESLIDTVEVGDSFRLMMSATIYFAIKGTDYSVVYDTVQYEITEQSIILTPAPGKYDGTQYVQVKLNNQVEGVNYTGFYQVNYTNDDGGFAWGNIVRDFYPGDTIEIPLSAIINVAFEGDDNTYCSSTNNEYTIEDTCLTLAKINKYSDTFSGMSMTVGNDLLIGKFLCNYTYTSNDQQWYGVGVMVRDLGENTAIDATTAGKNQVDYIAKSTNLMNGNKWQQNNWMLIWIEDVTQFDDTYKTEGNIIKGGTLKGTYQGTCYFKGNNQYNCYNFWTQTKPTIVAKDQDVTYNTYITCNFVPENTNINGNYGATGGDGRTYFFMNPKICEVVHIEWAQWNESYNCFVVPTGDNANTLGFDGYIYADWGLYYDKETGAYLDVPTLEDGTVYSFDAVVVAEAEDTGGGILQMPRRIASISEGYTVLPLSEPQEEPTSPTSVGDVQTGRTIESVQYYNVAGQASSTPHDGVNIIVTRYTDGTTSTTKLLQ